MAQPPAQAPSADGPSAAGLRAWLALGALSLLFFLITAGTFTSLGVALPDMVASLHWSWSEAALGYTLLALSCGLTSLLPAILVRRFGVRRTLYSGAGLMAAGFLTAGTSVTPLTFWAAAVMMGAGFSLTAIIPGAYVLTRSFSHKSTAIGAYYTAGALGGVAGPLIFTLIHGAALGWRGYWLMLAIAVAVTGVVAAVAVPPGADAADAKAGKAPLAPGDWSVEAALKTPQFWTITAAYTAYLLCETSLNGLSATHLTARGLTPAMAAGLLSLQALINAFARAGAGLIGERVAPRKVAIVALALVTVGIFALGRAQGWVEASLAVTAVGAGYGASSLATTLMLLQAFGRSRNLELMAWMCLVSTLAAAGPVIGGLVKDASGGLTPAFDLFAAVAAMALVALVALRPQRPVSA